MKQHIQEQAPIVQLVDTIIDKAVEQRASDIHFEPTETGLRVRYRIDGVLYDRDPITTQHMAQLLARLKVLAHLDITERRIPHDGKFSITYQGKPIDLRVSTFPSVNGEHIVVRILDRAKACIDLDHLGLNRAMQDTCLALFKRSNGFFLVTGPTGSGKTTTLYAALAALNEPGKHVITLEDPVEYHVEGVTQGQIHPEAGFTFEKGMRSILRQDPDIIMVGEIRDEQTARIAIQAALTGHSVLSTVHTADAPGVIMRLMDMGVEPFLINAAITGVLAQRLARTICASCRYERAPTDEEARILATLNAQLDRVYAGAGCSDCLHLGYKGRTGIFELLSMHDDLRSSVIREPSCATLRMHARTHGMKTLADDGLDKIRRGLITVHEFVRAVL